MQSPAPEKQRIRQSDSSEESTDDIIKNIEAVTEAEEDKKQEAEESSDSSDSTITERETERDKDLPETDGGSKKAVEALAIPASASGVDDTSSSSSSSSSTGGSSKKSDISSSDSSDSSRSYSSDSDTNTSSVDNNKKKKYKYNKMPSSSIIKSPVSDGSRATFEGWHSLWEVFGQEQSFNEYQSIVPHPGLPVDRHNAAKPVKTEKKAPRKNKKAITSLRVSFSGI
jgi:hypothetical protein